MFTKLKDFNLTPSVGALLILLVVLVPDISVRFAEMRIWSISYLGFYLLSMLMAYSGYYVSARLIANIRAVWLKNLFFVLISLFITTAVVSSLGYRSYFGNIPTIFTFQLLLLEPGEALVSAQNEFSISKIIQISLVWLLIFLLFKKIRPLRLKTAKIQLISLFLLFAGAWAILNNQVRFVDQCFTLDTNILITGGKMVQNRFSSRQFNRTGMHAGTRPRLTSSGAGPGFNLLVIINESVRSSSFPLNDTTFTQMPELMRRYRANTGDYFIFPNAYGTATTTMVAFPTALSGANSQTDVLAMHKLPLLWNYADKFECDQYLISSHMYHWRNFVSFVNDKSLEKLWYYEISGQPALDGYYGIDDRHTLDTLLHSLDGSVKNERNFMAVFHTFDQHYPYFYPGKKSDTHEYSDYIRSQGYLDQLFTRIEKFLQDKKIADNTIILFTSDHGEAFNEHNQLGHIGIVYREAANVSFFLKIPAGLQNRYDLSALRQNQQQVVSNSDLAPTIIDLYNLRQDKEISPIIPQLPGKSLFEPIPDQRKVIVSSNTEYAVMRDEHGIGIYGKNESLVFNTRGGQPQFKFYDLQKDPQQTRNIWPQISDSVKLEYEKIFLTNINLKRTYDLVIKKSFIGYR